jgi:hypothetical protein
MPATTREGDIDERLKVRQLSDRIAIEVASMRISRALLAAAMIGSSVSLSRLA